jgi:hypothetical protein
MKSSIQKQEVYMNIIFRLVLVILLVLTVVGQSASVIVNEYNAVGSEKYLETDTYEGSTKADVRMGRIVGNGGDWIELVVVEDHADLRNYQIRWWELDSSVQYPSNLEAIWATSIDKIGYNQGIITFKDIPFWSNLRKGTIITLCEEKTIIAENGSIVVNGHKVETNLVPGSQGDWWINIWTADPAELYVHTETQKLGDLDGNFSVGNDDWEVNIFDGTTVIFGPIGEMYEGFGSNINSREIAKLQADPSSSSTVNDFSDGTSSTFSLPNVWHNADTGEDFTQNFDALRKWSWRPGDANLDNAVDVGDLGILAANYGQSDKTWRMGDFNGDGTVDVGDLGILAANYGFASGEVNAESFDQNNISAMGTAVSEEDKTEEADSTLCTGLGLPLITVFMIAGLMMKLDD